MRLLPDIQPQQSNLCWTSNTARLSRPPSPLPDALTAREYRLRGLSGASGHELASSVIARRHGQSPSRTTHRRNFACDLAEASLFSQAGRQLVIPSSFRSPFIDLNFRLVRNPSTYYGVRRVHNAASSTGTEGEVIAFAQRRNLVKGLDQQPQDQ